MSTNDAFLDDLVSLSAQCDKFVMSKDRDQAYNVIYDNLQMICTKELEGASSVSPDTYEYVKSVLNRVLGTVNTVKKLEDFSIQKAIAKKELADEIIDKLRLPLEESYDELPDEEDLYEEDE